MNLVTPKALAKHEHLFNRLASAKFMPYLPHHVSGLFADDKEYPKSVHLSGSQLRPSSFPSHSQYNCELTQLIMVGSLAVQKNYTIMSGKNFR